MKDEQPIMSTEKTEKDVIIIGAGIIGLCAAFYLSEQGYSVLVIDKNSEETKNCSYGNAGLITPSHFVPLAAPGVITQGLKWMLNSKSPFYIKPRLKMDLIKWIRLFKKHSTAEHVDNSVSILRSLNLESKKLYQNLDKISELELNLQEKGLMMLFKTEKEKRHELKFAQRATEMGVECKEIDSSVMNDLLGIETNVLGGVHLEGDAQINPEKFIGNLRKYLKSRDVEFLYQTSVENFDKSDKKIKQIITNKGELRALNFIIAGGSWSGLIAKKLDYNIPLQAGKGYSFSIHPGKQNLKIPSICCETKVAVTPLNDHLKFSGTMEINGHDSKNSAKRISAIESSINNYFPTLNHSNQNSLEVWSGLRPCSPDGLPYIGRTDHSNLLIACGHGMMGLSTGPITGKLVSQLVNEEKTNLPMDQLNPLRFNK